jgi:uridine phosphorylase
MYKLSKADEPDKIENDMIPLLNHSLNEPTAFTPRSLMDSARRARCIPDAELPPVCILEFDGDITDWLVAERLAHRYPAWPCFHTTMFAIEVEDVRCSIIPRTIGGPYAVLIAEQLAACGVKLIIGLTSAGRISRELPLPCLVSITSAVRDEGTSLHYLPASKEVGCPAPDIAVRLEKELAAVGWAVRSGKVWTTDAPYRETQTQLQMWEKQGVLAVEMQAASLFAFGVTHDVRVASVAMVSNAVDHEGEQFNTGTQRDGLRIIEACARVFKHMFSK